jgi:membrane-associated protein
MPEWLKTVFDHCLHLDKVLPQLTQTYGAWIYGILFVVVFCETGLVITPFLPGDSLLFAAGVIAAEGTLNPWLIILILGAAAVAGDAVNYSIGHYVGPKVFSRKQSRLFNPKHLDEAQRFYEKYGAKAIVIARFVPIVRTFVPFVAGIGRMGYKRFAIYNVLGGALWVTGLTMLGYWFGNVPIVKRNFSAVILAIIVISVLPGVIEVLRSRRKQSKKDA